MVSGASSLYPPLVVGPFAAIEGLEWVGYYFCMGFIVFLLVVLSVVVLLIVIAVILVAILPDGGWHGVR